MISRANISKELTPNLGNARRRKKMAKKKDKDFKKALGLNPKSGRINATKKAGGGMTRVGLSPAEEKRSGTYSEADRRKNMNKGGTAKVGKKKQGYSAREDESLGMRTGPERSKSQSMAARRDESYGDWGKRKRGRVNVKKGGSIKKMSSGGVALRGHGAEIR
jgi:hypothetical protein